MTTPDDSPVTIRDVFGTVSLEAGASVGSASDGDLWPTAWADDGHLYTANGDGAGFAAEPFSDIAVSRIEGDPGTGLTGERLAAERDVSPVWGDPGQFNCKPTGMVAVDGNGDGRDELYLAVQDLPYGIGPGTFDHAPNASIVASTDYGHTWHATGEPMFTDHVFTTIMFLDFGQSNSGASVLGDDAAGFVYAYGLDGNWRTSYAGVVPDPVDLFLARAPIDAIQERAAWQFYAGPSADGHPLWSTIEEKQPVLTDTRRLYEGVAEPSGRAQSVIAQGGVVYNAPLQRYLYTSWTEFTFQFYVADQPWGRWTLFHQHDFGPFPWIGPDGYRPRHGGYATTIPSKFISANGKDMWLQSNWFIRPDARTGKSYHYSLRRLEVQPLTGDDATNPADGAANLARPETGAVVVAAHCHTGHPEVLNDGNHTTSEDSWNGLTDKIDFWGYTWPSAQHLNTLVLTSGPRDYVSGWFAEQPRVEIRIDGEWQELTNTAISPDYPLDHRATGHRTFTLTFPTVSATGVRITGRPHGVGGYTSIAELEVYHRGTVG